MNISVMFLHNEEPVTIILDFVELSMSHTGVNMATAFVKVMKDYNIEFKVSSTHLTQLSTHQTSARLAQLELKSPVRSGLFILKFEDHRPAGPQIFSDFKDCRPGPVLNQDR